MYQYNTSHFIWEEVIPGGNHWSGLIRRGTALRITDMEGGANLSALFYNPEDKLERYNMPDTLKAQHTAFLTTGNVCYSDMGRVMCSIINDSVGWHDTICGITDAGMIAAKYGKATYQTHRNAMYRNGKDGLLVELAKYGLGKRDLVANVNFFSKVIPDDAGNLSFVTGNSKVGSYVDVRFDMNVLLVLSSAPHPLIVKPLINLQQSNYPLGMLGLQTPMIFAAMPAPKMGVALRIPKDIIYEYTNRKQTKATRRCVKRDL